MLRPSLRHGQVATAALVAGIMLVLLGAVWRLSSGPIALDLAKPAVERLLATEVQGGRATIGSVDLVWFSTAQSLGLRLHNVDLTDGRGRSVLHAGQVETGLAMHSLALFNPAPGRLAARNFFVAVSVSPQGRYALGYDASGAPISAGNDLWRLFDDLTGKVRQSRPLSFLKDVDLADGVIAFRQVGGPVNWRGDVRTVRFQKARGKLSGNVDLRIGDADLTARARGSVGLKRAQLDASVAKLDPARIFPWVGPTSRLSTLDAMVEGAGSLNWASDRGVQAADIRLVAGSGQIRLGGAPAPFRSAELRIAFDPRTQHVVVQTARATSSRADLDVTGEAWLIPESRRGGPAKLEVSLKSAHSLVSLSPWSPPQSVDNFAARGRYVARTGAIVIDSVRGDLAGSPLALSGQLLRPKDQRSWGVQLAGTLGGMMTPQQVAAFWPDELAGDVRDWSRDHVSGGKLGRANLRLKLAPGAFQPHRPVPNDQIQLSFEFADADISVTSSMPHIEHAVGVGVLQGDRFDLTVRTAKIEHVDLSAGAVRIPRLIGDDKRLEFEGRAMGDAHEMLDIVDRSTGGVPSRHGFEPKRLGGTAAIDFSIGRPFDEAEMKDYDVAYRGVIRDAKVSDAVLGLGLEGPLVKLDGSLDHVAADGDVRLGPYRGTMKYNSDFPANKAATQKAEFDGLLDSSTVGLTGPAGSTIRFSAKFDGAGGDGRGVIRSKAFDGETTWRSGGDGRFSAQGVVDAAALRSIGVPVGKGVPARVPTHLTLTRAGAGWNGVLDADAYSGTIVMSGGGERRLRYSAQLTAQEAQKLGFADGPVGTSPTSLSLDVSMNDQSGSASYGVGSWLGQVSWARGVGAKTQYRWRTTLSATELRAMGLPAAIQPKSPLPIDVVLSSNAGGWSGSAQLSGGAIKFSSTAPSGGKRRLNLNGSLDGATFSDLGLGPVGMIAGPAAVSATLDMGADGLRGGHVDADFQRAAVNAPYVSWKKLAGHAMRFSADFTRHPDGALEATEVKGQGAGFSLAASGAWKPKVGGALRIANAKLEGAFDGSLELDTSDGGDRLVTRARYFDARRLIQQGGARAQGGAGQAVTARPLRIDAQLNQVRVSEAGIVKNVRLVADWGGDGQRVDLSVVRDDGGPFISLRLNPDAEGAAITGQVSDVGEAASAVFGSHSFRGGQATVYGRLVEGGADLHVEMTKVRLVQAPSVARILTVGSLRGMADMVNGSGVEFSKVVAPVSIRGSRLTIGRARATGPVMSVTTQGVIDFDSRSVDLSGGIAPAYMFNTAMGGVPVVGDLLTSHKGEGVFGVTYSAKGALLAPKLTVNPFSLATPGILRRIFEGHSSAEKLADGG